MTADDQLLVSIFPSEKWICSSSSSGEMITSESTEDEKIAFSAKHDTSHKAIQNAKIFNCSKDFATAPTAPVEFNNASGGNIFTDRGKKITFDREHVTDDEIRAALAHAAEKFGGSVNLTGEDQAFTDRMARFADDMGIVVLNPELQSVIAAHREFLAASAPSCAPALKKKASRFWQRVFFWRQ